MQTFFTQGACFDAPIPTNFDSTPYLSQSYCTSYPLLSFCPWLCSHVVKRKEARPGTALADVWLLERKQSRGDERKWKCTYGFMPTEPGLFSTVFRSSFLLLPAGWGGIKESSGGAWADAVLRSNTAVAV